MKRALVLTLSSVVILVLLTALSPQLIAGAAPEQEQSVAPVARQASGRTIVVTSSADAGPGTFRQALLDAQSGDTITFDPTVFPPDNPVTVAVISPLPALAQGEVTIDASNAGVILDGSQILLGEYIAGLSISSSGNVIRGLQILHFSGSGVYLANGSQHNVIGGTMAEEHNVISGNYGGVTMSGNDTMYNIVSGNYIGTNATGTVAIGNLVDGVWIGEGAQYNMVGGATEGERNIISGNGNNGVVIDGSMHNTISGNYIGTDVTGTGALGNGVNGVAIAWGSQFNLVGGATTGERNVISGNVSIGVLISDLNTSNNTVSGNYIGTDATGTVAIGNMQSGVHIGDGAQNNLVGGDTAGKRNIISGNRAVGVNIFSSNNTVCGNYIGTDVTGTSPLSNGYEGVSINNGASNNTIGGLNASPGEACSGECNLISGNDHEGIWIGQSDTTSNTVSGNYIGTDVNGVAVIGNKLSGIQIDNGGSYNIIGGDTSGESNLISGNDVGVSITGSDTKHNTITANSIHHNDGLGIQNSGGGNAELSPPTITHVGTRLLRGSAPSNSMVEIFSDQEDEGQIYEGSTIADEEGNFAFQMPVGRFTGPNITITATDAEGNTSQFSLPESPPAPAVTRELPGIVAPTQVSVEPEVVGTNLGLAIFSVLFFGFTSTIFNSILEDYRDELVGAFGKLIPRKLADALNRIDGSLRGMTKKGRGSLLMMWLAVLLVTTIIESFLDPEVGILSPERLGIWITLFVSALIVSALELGSDLYAHRRWAPTLKFDSKVQWIGMSIAIACVILSRALDFKPGYMYGIVGTIYLMPKLADITHSGKRAIFVLLTIFAGGFIVWIVSSFLPASLAVLEPLFLTIFLLSLQGVFFQLFPLSVTNGGDIWSWRRGVWFVSFSIVFFCFYHFLLNPNASDVQALQQNGVQTLLILIAVFGLATFALWLLLPFRLGRKRAGGS